MTAGNGTPGGNGTRLQWPLRKLWLLGVMLAFTGVLFVIGPAFWSMAKRHLPVSPTLGDILVDTPEVYTRERLVNDRFQQEAWLRSQLERTDDLLKDDRFARPEGRLRRAEETAATVKAGLSEHEDNQHARQSDTSGALNAPAAINFKPNPIDEFRDAQAYRDVIRSDLMRTQLDDRHDIEGNTLYRLDFDVTVSPGDNTTGLAVVTVAVQEAEDTDHSMYKSVFWDFQRELQAEIDGAVKNQADALYYSSEGLPGVEKLAFQEHLQRKTCDALRKIAKQLDPKSAPGDDNSASGAVAPDDYSEKMYTNCVQAVGAAISAYTKNAIELKNEEYELQYADKLREDLRNYAADALPPPLGELQKLNLEDTADISFEKLQKIRRTLRGAARYAGFMCQNVKPTPEGKQFYVGVTEVNCPPDRNPNEATLATVSMLRRLETVIGLLKQETRNRTLNEQLLILVRKSPDSLWALAHNLDHIIGPYGDPLINVLCGKKGWQSSPICKRDKGKIKINWDLCDNTSWNSWPPCKGAEFHDVLDLFDTGAPPLERDALERVVAEFALMKLNGRLSIYQFDHPLRDFFSESHIDCTFGECTLVLAPSKDGADKLYKVLNEHDRAFSYAVMPTEWNQALATEELTRTSFLAAMENAAASGSANLKTAMSGLNEFEERVDMLHRNPVVIGFAVEPTQEEDLKSNGWLDWPFSVNNPQNAKNYESEDRTDFGWIIRPRVVTASQSGGLFQQTPGSYPLSAVVSVPSWWRLLKIEIWTDWVDPNAWWFNPQSAVASLRASRGPGKVHYVRVPGSVKEIKEKLNYEVRKEPYINFDATAAVQFLEIGRRGQIVLEGGRLWRSTVARMGDQQADRIIVLPDMNGIVVEFSCVEPPPGVPGIGWGDPNDQRLTVPVYVWTSEGRTAQPLHVFLKPFVPREPLSGEAVNGQPPCFLSKKERQTVTPTAASENP
jgi:hypothetical protein